MDMVEKGTTRRHTFFCINRERHTRFSKVVEAVPKEILVLGKMVRGWLVTTEESAIDKVIHLNESLSRDVSSRDPE